MNLEILHTPNELGTKIIDGREAEKEVTKFIRENFDLSKYKVALHLVEPVQITPRTEASLVSLKKKIHLINALGAQTETHVHKPDTSLSDFSAEIMRENQDLQVIGEIIQFPIAPHLQGIRYIIDQVKDIDAINPIGNTWTFCATSEAAIKLLELHASQIRRIALLGAKGFVGKQIASQIQNNELGELVQIEFEDSLTPIKNSDTIISSVGQPNLVQARHLSNPHLGIDIGNVKHNTEFRGDFDFDSVNGKIANITPVPKGMGPLEMVILAERIVRNAINPNFRINFYLK